MRRKGSKRTVSAQVLFSLFIPPSKRLSFKFTLWWHKIISCQRVVAIFCIITKIKSSPQKLRNRELECSTTNALWGDVWHDLTLPRERATGRAPLRVVSAKATLQSMCSLPIRRPSQITATWYTQSGYTAWTESTAESGFWGILCIFIILYMINVHRCLTFLHILYFLWDILMAWICYPDFWCLKGPMCPYFSSKTFKHLHNILTDSEEIKCFT